MSIKSNSFLRTVVYTWRSIRNKCSYKRGRNNQIINNGAVRVASRIQIEGDGNRVILEKGSVFLNSLVRVSGNNNEVILKAGCYVSGAELWVEDNHCVLSIGEGTFVGHHSQLACTEDNSKIIIGDDGLISSYVQIRTGDSHSIFDLDGNRINHARSVTIGNHCWLGEGSKILKGVTLEADIIVSTGAIVTKSYGKNLLIGGIPARVLKDNVKWDIKRV